MSQLERLVRDLSVDLVHVHTPIAGFLTRYALSRGDRARRPAVVYTAHGFHVFDGGRPASNFVYGLAEAVAGRWTDALIVINDQDELRARRLRMVPAQRLHHMPGIGIDLSHFDPTSVPAEVGLSFRRERGIPPDAPMYVMIAELHRPKRPLDAVAAIAGGGELVDSHLVILGDGPLGEAIKRYAAARGLADRVHLCGFVDDVRPALRSATAGILTSAREGLPRALMETLAMGVPVVCTDARGCREVVGRAGLIVPVGDVAALSAGLKAVTASTSLRRQMAETARAEVDKFAIGRLLTMHERLYGHLMDQPSTTMSAAQYSSTG